MRANTSSGLAVLSIIGGLLAGNGCEKLKAKTFAISVVTRTPSVAEAQQMDLELLSVIGADKLPAATAALVGAGERSSVTSTAAPKPLTGATVSISYPEANDAVTTVRLCPVTSNSGTYAATSAAALTCGSGGTPVFDYVVGSTYTTTIGSGGDTYTLGVTAPDRIDPNVVSFDPPLASDQVPGSVLLLRHALHGELRVDWSRAPEGKDVFVSLLRVRFTGNFQSPTDLIQTGNWQAEPSNPIWDNVPRTASQMLDFITGSPPTDITIPAGEFDEQGLYVLIVTVADASTQTSSNLSLGSGALAGWGTAFAFVAY